MAGFGRRTQSGKPPASGRRPRSLSLKGLLFCLLLPGMLMSLAFDSYNDYQTLTDITRSAYDQALRQPVGMLERSVDLDAQGTVSVSTPWYAWQMLESQPEETIYYQVKLLQPPAPAGPGDMLKGSVTLLGMTDMPEPVDWSALEGPSIAFYDATFRGEPVRVAARLRRLTRGDHAAVVLVQVAQRSLERMRAESLAWKQEWRRDLRAVAVVALLLWLGVSWGLRPLSLLRREVAGRKLDDTAPLDVSRVPAEVAPLVQAVNHHIARHRSMVDGQAGFLADASHQLRTPLAVLLTQAEYALREPEPEQVRESLRAMIERLGTTRRLTEQLLSLALAQHAAGDCLHAFDLMQCARGVLLEYLPLAERKGIDLGWDDRDGQADSLHALGHVDGIREALSNLVHNAICYIPAGGRVTLSVGSDERHAWAAVSDNGQGIPADRREQAFERFVRGLDSSDAAQKSAGAGLGLAIARAFVEGSRGHLELCDGESSPQGGYGLRATLFLQVARSVPLAQET